MFAVHTLKFCDQILCFHTKTLAACCSDTHSLLSLLHHHLSSPNFLLHIRESSQRLCVSVFLLAKEKVIPPWNWSLSNQVKEGGDTFCHQADYSVQRQRAPELIFILQLRQAQESSTLGNIPANEADFQMSSQQQAPLIQDRFERDGNASPLATDFWAGCITFSLPF